MISKVIRWPLLVFAATMMLTATADAQQPAPGPGRIVGRILDSSTGNGLSAVTVQVLGSNLVTMSGLDGRFIINNVPEGTVTLQASSIGYGAKTVTGVSVNGGRVAEQNISLETQAIEIGALEVTAAAERGSVNRALDQQRSATGIVSAITAEQIAKSPDGDAAAAVQRVSGVTVQDNKFVSVRGLGERYTTTSLNGARIPSPEPEKKMVPLDIFPAGLIETVTTSKTFTPDQPGDFSGAQVNIKTREFPGERTQSLSTSFGFNTVATGKNLPGGPGLGAEWIGFGQGGRAIPSVLRHTRPGDLTAEQQLHAIRSFNNNWTPASLEGRPNTSFAASVGGNSELFGRQLGYVVSGTYSHSYEAREGEVRARPQLAPDQETVEIDRFVGSTGRTSVLWGGIANFSSLIGSSTRLALNTTYNRSADNEARDETGTLEDRGGRTFRSTRLRYVERSVGSAQLIGQHEVRRRHNLDWSLSGSAVTRDEPDRAEFLYLYDMDAATGQPLPPTWYGDAEGAVRTFAELDERSAEANLNYKFGFGAGERHSVKVGAVARLLNRDAFNHAFSIAAPNMSRSEAQLAPEEIFGDLVATAEPGEFRLNSLAQGGSYTAEDRLIAGYVMSEYAATDKIRVIAGARIENSRVKVNTETQGGGEFAAEPGYTDVLPSLAINYQLNEQSNLRLSGSQTLSRPEYRELAPVVYREVIGGDNVFGNDNLVRTVVRNLDLRWETYPNAGEVMSIALFAKHFRDPIERLYLGTSGTPLVTFYNADAALSYGVELEIRKNLAFINESLRPLTVFANTTVMHSEISADSTNISGNTFVVNTDRSMVGQAPYVVNAGIAFSNESGARSATLLYNTVGRRVYSASDIDLPPVYEQPRHVLDLAVRLPIMQRFAAKLDLKNLLDADHEITQGAATREYYRSGRSVSVGVSWRP